MRVWCKIRQSPKEKAIGLVKLPMPNSLADSNNVSWGEDQLNAPTAAATSAAMGTMLGDAILQEAVINFAQIASQDSLEVLVEISRSTW